MEISSRRLQLPCNHQETPHPAWSEATIYVSSNGDKWCKHYVNLFTNNVFVLFFKTKTLLDLCVQSDSEYAGSITSTGGYLVPMKLD